MKLGQQIVNCSYNSSVTAAAVRDNQEDDGFLVVTMIESGDAPPDNDNEETSPVPKVKLADAVGEYIYGAVATRNEATARCGVITGGIVPLKSTATTTSAMIGFGVVSSGTAGEVAVAAAGLGRGTVVGRTAGNILWVDLDVDVNATA